MNYRGVVFLLVLFICGSLGIIGSKLYQRSISSELSVAQPVPVVPPRNSIRSIAAQPVPRFEAGAANAAGPMPTAAIMGTSNTLPLRSISADNWDKGVATIGPVAKKYSESPGCKPNEPGFAMLPLREKKVAENLVNGGDYKKKRGQAGQAKLEY
jgi:hypothetical protein